MDIRKWFSPDKLETIKPRSPDTDKTHEILSPKWEVIKVFTDGSTINNGDKKIDSDRWRLLKKELR